MKIFGFNITTIEKKPTFWTHVVFVSTKRGRKILYINGKEYKGKDTTIQFWVDSEGIAKLDNVNYTKQVMEK